MGHTLPLNSFHKHNSVCGWVDFNSILKAGSASPQDTMALMVFHHYTSVYIRVLTQPHWPEHSLPCIFHHTLHECQEEQHLTEQQPNTKHLAQGRLSSP